MTDETPIRPRAEYDATPEFESEDLADVAELLRRAANWHEAAHNETIAAELRAGAAVVDAAVATPEPRDGESADGSGGVRPVPPGVASEPEVRDE